MSEPNSTRASSIASRGYSFGAVAIATRGYLGDELYPLPVGPPWADVVEYEAGLVLVTQEEVVL